MAGTMPHAIFVETGLPDGEVAAYAAELPGCATFATTDVEATTAIPARVARFTSWLQRHGLATPTFVGDNWYEVERAAASGEGAAVRRAAFTLDELPPSDEEFGSYLTWLELAREELADAVDATGDPAADALERVARQDEGFARELGAGEAEAAPSGDPVGRLYLARDLLTDRLIAGGATADSVRRIFRIAIADDLRLAEALWGARG
jgi:hypothetical protein